MLEEILSEMKENLKDFSNHPQRQWLQSFIIEHKGDYYINSIQDKNRLSEEDKIIVQYILDKIGYIKWDTKLRFNVANFYKEYKLINKNK